MEVVMDTGPCIAYIDPGSGTLVLQAILAAALGGLFWLGGRLRRCLPGSARHRATEDTGPMGP
jgi:hypothetical protein